MQLHVHMHAYIHVCNRCSSNSYYATGSSAGSDDTTTGMGKREAGGRVGGSEGGRDGGGEGKALRSRGGGGGGGGVLPGPVP